MANQSNKSSKRQRRTAFRQQVNPSAADTTQAPPARSERKPSKLDQVEAMLVREGGTSIAEIMTATGWQQHSVRGAMAGALKKRRLIITSEKNDGPRRYHASQLA